MTVTHLSLALLQFRQNDIAAAKETLSKGQARIPVCKISGVEAGSGRNTAQAAGQFERVVDLLPEWPGSYSTP